MFRVFRHLQAYMRHSLGDLSGDKEGLGSSKALQGSRRVLNVFWRTHRPLSSSFLGDYLLGF